MGILYKTFKPFRTVFCLVFLAMISIASAQDTASLYTVQNINVDVSAENALKAREQAFEQAQVKAFEELAGRLLDEAVFANFGAPPAQTISMMIQDYEVSEEKIASKRYSGTYIFRFRRSVVDKYLSIQSPQPPLPVASSPVKGVSAPDVDNDVDNRLGPETSPQDYYTPPSYSSTDLSGGHYQVHAAFSSLAEWTNIQRALARVSGVNDIALKALSPREAYFDLDFSGDLPRLQRALAQAGLDLTPLRRQNTEEGPVYELGVLSGMDSGSSAASSGGSSYQGRF